MSTVVYLTNQYVQVVVGNGRPKKISVQKTYSVVAPEGSIINGIIMDEAAFVEFLRSFWREKNIPTKDVCLVINSTKFVGKSIEMPLLNEAKTLEFIKREFADVKKSDDEIYGYIPLSGVEGKVRRVYAESITPDFIQNYIDVFREIGISIKEISSGESCLINLVNMTLSERNNTFLVEIAEGMTLTLLLYVNNSFYYFNTVRCFNEPGSQEYGYEVARSISQIVQFMQANQIEHPLEKIWLAGFSDVDIVTYTDIMREQGIHVPVVMYDSTSLSATGRGINDFLHATSGLCGTGKAQNFLIQYNTKSKRRTSNELSGVSKLAPKVIGGTFVLMLLLLGVSFAFSLVKKMELASLEAYNKSPAVLKQLEEYKEADERNLLLTNQYQKIQELDKNIYTYPVCDNEILDVFDACASGYVTVKFESFDADQGVVTITATSEDVDNISKFIEKLLAKDTFYSVDYTGYTFDESTQLWDIHVTCTLAESAGR